MGPRRKGLRPSGRDRTESFVVKVPLGVEGRLGRRSPGGGTEEPLAPFAPSPSALVLYSVLRTPAPDGPAGLVAGPEGGKLAAARARVNFLSSLLRNGLAYRRRCHLRRWKSTSSLQDLPPSRWSRRDPARRYGFGAAVHNPLPTRAAGRAALLDSPSWQRHPLLPDRPRPGRTRRPVARQARRPRTLRGPRAARRARRRGRWCCCSVRSPRIASPSASTSVGPPTATRSTPSTRRTGRRPPSSSARRCR